MTDYEKLKKLLSEINVPFEVFDDNTEYESISIIADASDKYVTITFNNGIFSYSN